VDINNLLNLVLYDRDTPKTCSRSRKWFRRSIVWRYFADYFPIHLVKTCELNPKRNYVFACHPHGVLAVGMFANFATEGTGFSETFPGITPFACTLAGQFCFPIRREYILMTGCIEVSKEALGNVLRESNKGHAAVITVGGASEILRARPGHYDLVLGRRKGFIRAAIVNGADLVPVLSFGEIELFNQCEYGPKSFWYTRIQDTVKRLITYPIVIFYARGVLNYSSGFMPHRKPVFTVVGSPIRVKKDERPSQRKIDKLHCQYVEELKQLFENHKLKYNVPIETHLNVVC